jgi:hypothetical protein
MAENPDPALVRAPDSNASLIASHLVYHTVDFDGSGLIETLNILLARAEQVRKLNHRLILLDERVAKKEVTSQEEYNAELLDGLYETTCMKWFMASAFKELAKRLEGEVYGAQVRCVPIKQITYNADGEVESFRLESSEDKPT